MRKLPKFDMYVPLNQLPASLKRGIGGVCHAHSLLEYHTSLLLYDALRLDNGLGRLAFTEGGPIEHFRIIKRLFNYWDFKPSVASLTTITKELTACSEARNELAHGIWFHLAGQYRVRQIAGDYTDDEAGLMSRLLLPTTKPIDVDDLNNVVARIYEAVKMIQSIRTELRDALKSWPRTTPGQPPQCSTCGDRSPIGLRPPPRSS